MNEAGVCPRDWSDMRASANTISQETGFTLFLPLVSFKILVPFLGINAFLTFMEMNSLVIH